MQFLSYSRTFHCNSSLNESIDGYISKDYVNIGIAVDTERGLMVPNIKNADKLSVQEISENINELAQKAKNKKIKPEDLKELLLAFLH